MPVLPFVTQSYPALRPATEGSDFTSSNGEVTFLTGESLKVISVPALADADNSETDETFLVTLSNPDPSTVTIADGTGVGTITTANPQGALLISEIRTFGATNATDDFIEIYNNSDTQHIVDSPDNTGYGIFKMGADCNVQPILIGIIPEGTTIDGRSHFLLTGSSYSLKDYGGTDAAKGDALLTSDLENNRNVALFSTATLTSISTLNRFDAAGFGTNVGVVCNLLREGSPTGGLMTNPGEHTFFRKQCDFVAGVGCSTPGIPKDTNANINDFQFADPEGDNTSAGQRLGAPGPQNLSSPRSDKSVPASLLDSTQSSSQSPNRQRFTAAEDSVAPFGALVIRRKFHNNTGGHVARLRFRVIEITTFPPPTGAADLRAFTSSDTNINNVMDTETCAEASGTPPCTVTVRGTTLEQPPVQTLGGGINSSLTVTLGTPLPDGDAIPVQFRLGIFEHGNYNFCVLAEGLPSGGTQVFCDSGHTAADPPTISKAFSSPTVALNGTATLTFTITNSNASIQLDGVAFTDTLPSGLVVADTPNVTGVCGGTVTATAGTDTISLSGGSITGGGNCVISVDVKGTSPGIKNNTTGAVSSTTAGTGLTSNTAQIEVLKTPTNTGVTSSNNPSEYAENVTFTATVTSGSGTPTGSVQFKDNGNNLGAPVALNGSGVAQVSTNSLTPGTHVITADYLGDSNFAISTGTLAGGQLVINLAGWTTTGANGAVEDESNPQRPTYTNFTAVANPGSPAGTYILRYNITAAGNLALVGAVNTRLRVRFRDEGAGSRVTVSIVRSPITGGAVTIGTLFDSDVYTPGSGFQTQEILMSPLTFDFTQNTYWLEVRLTKEDTSNQPGFGSAHINQQ